MQWSGGHAYNLKTRTFERVVGIGGYYPCEEITSLHENTGVVSLGKKPGDELNRPVLKCTSVGRCILAGVFLRKKSCEGRHLFRDGQGRRPKPPAGWKLQGNRSKGGKQFVPETYPLFSEILR